MKYCVTVLCFSEVYFRASCVNNMNIISLKGRWRCLECRAIKTRTDPSSVTAGYNSESHNVYPRLWWSYSTVGTCTHEYFTILIRPVGRFLHLELAKAYSEGLVHWSITIVWTWHDYQSSVISLWWPVVAYIYAYILKLCRSVSVCVYWVIMTALCEACERRFPYMISCMLGSWHDSTKWY